jgi:Cupin-like domain
MTPVGEIDGRGIADAAQFLRDVVVPCRPLILRNLVSDWPVVRAGLQSPSALQQYLLGFGRGREVEAFFGAPAIAGKYYYESDDLKGFNFERRRVSFADALEAIVATPPEKETIYVGSLPASAHLPGYTDANPMPLLPASAQPRLWLGHASNVSTHYDAFENLACVVAGTRRFTLFPPEAIDKLYVGPIDNTMAGQPVSLAAASAPDGERYPLFEDIRDEALVAELAPGDALFLPKLWWHKVESTAPFNGLVNYWWDAFAAGPDAPYTAMLLAMISIAERPAPERAAWRAYFDHYVFRTEGHPLRHLPTALHGVLGPLKENYGRLRAHIMHLLRGA